MIQTCTSAHLTHSAGPSAKSRYNISRARYKMKCRAPYSKSRMRMPLKVLKYKSFFLSSAVSQPIMMSFICYLVLCSLGHKHGGRVSEDHLGCPGFHPETGCISVHGPQAAGMLVFLSPLLPSCQLGARR